ncbi:MAG: aminotransferase class I/II-fold pyridoxal phosphate-dependent enzyme [Candidatus Limiplasma sp.]|nr:aminotransferase class I/II-fold pyridoxal phosphate-dependent enzyme [Candidatus Limiplasma sp.]
MNLLDIGAISRTLRADMRLETLYHIICNYGDTEAAVWLENGQEKSYTFQDYARMTRNYAAAIRKQLGAAPGAYVAISLDTCKEWFPVFWGVIQAGYNALLVDAALSDDMVAYLLGQSGAKGIIAAKTRALPEGVTPIMLTSLMAAPDAPADFVAVYGDQVGLCTSGTTGTSRIFVYHGHAVVEQVLSSEILHRAQKRIIGAEHRRALAFLPFHHVFGFMANVMWVHFLGYANIYMENRTPQVILETAQRFQPELLMAVPLLANNFCAGLSRSLSKQSALKRGMFKVLKGISLGVQTVAPSVGLTLAEKLLFAGIDRKLLGTNIKVIILGGSHTPSEHLRTLNALGYYTVCGFGMTETAVTSLETTLNLRKRVSGSVGKPLNNVEYRVTPGEKKGRRGEMLIRGKSIHTGRLVDGQLLPPDTLEGGWYPTGDVVRLEKGDRMFVEGRCKDVIINESGENVYPDELEDAFSAMEGVEQFTVLGVLKPGKNQKYEDIVLAMNVGDHYKDDAYLESLMRQVLAVNAKLPTLKRVSRVIVTAEKLPLVNGIKVKRLALKTMLQENKLAYRDLRMTLQKTAPQEAPAPEVVAREVKPTDLQMNEIKQKVRALYAEALSLDVGAFADDAHFIDDLHGDSLQVLAAALKAEEQFNVNIPVEEYGRCTTVEDMSALIYGKLNGVGAYENQSQPDEEITPIRTFEETPEFIAFQNRMHALMSTGEDNPYFVCHESPLRDKSLMAGHEVLNFGSYNYVGMSGRPEVQAAAKAAIDQYGTSASGSRLLAGEKKLYQELERELADWKHAEDCLVLVGGHSTNVTLVGNFCGKNDLIVYDALAHNSIEQGCRLSRATSKPFPHNDPEALESILRTQRDRYAKVLIVIEGAYSMDGDIANVPAFVALKKKYGCFLLVDEAHSACVIGETGGGVDEYFGLAPDDVDIKMGTLSKGLGTCGGYLAGSRSIIEYLRYNLPGFVFSVGISPPLAAATLESVRQLRHNPQIMADMKRNIDCFAAEARARSLDICLAGHTAVIPVMVGRDEDAFLLSNKMRERGVFVPPAVYPAVPKNKARLRFCVISEHKPEQIVTALDTLVALAAELDIKLPTPSGK